MEFTNEIFFNKKLIANENVIISYSGKLYREHSAQVYIVYGFGENWDYTSTLPMVETENGFEITVELKDYNIFNFCFKNDYNIWDNNNNCNYIAPISQEHNSISDGSSDIESTISNSVSLEETSQEVENESKEENTENKSENAQEFDNVSDKEIEEVFASLLDSILDLNTQKKANTQVAVEDLSGFGLQSVDEIKEEDSAEYTEIFNEFEEDVAQNTEETFTTNYENFSSEELEQLMDNLLDSILASQAQENINNLVENIKPTTDIENLEIQNIETQEINNQPENTVANELENSNLPAVIKNDGFLDSFLEVTYNVVKKIEVACKKVGTLIKLKAQEYGLVKGK